MSILILLGCDLLIPNCDCEPKNNGYHEAGEPFQFKRLHLQLAEGRLSLEIMVIRITRSRIPQYTLTLIKIGFHQIQLGHNRKAHL